MNGEKEMLEKSRSAMRGDRYAVDATGIDLKSVSATEVVASLRLTDLHRNVRGVVMGGALFTMADFVAAVLANFDCIAGDSPFQWVTSASEIHFLTVARGEYLEAKCGYVRRGKSLSVLQTDIFDAEQRHVARISTTMISTNR